MAPWGARYRRIVFFFARVIAGLIWWELVLPRFGLRAAPAPTRSDRLRRIAARFRALAIRMGGVMIKVGQFLSARLDVLPPEITDELAGLQDEVPPEDFEAIRALAEAELGAPLSTAYASFDETPLAAASLGPGAPRAYPREAIARRTVRRSRGCGSRSSGPASSSWSRPTWPPCARVRAGSSATAVGKRADVPALLEEFARTTHEEIDYLAEGATPRRFGQPRGAPRRARPEVAWSHTDDRVSDARGRLGIKITDYDAITAAGIDRRRSPTVLLDTYMQQIFEDGFFHADPHPGNLFVTPSDKPGDRSRLAADVRRLRHGRACPPETCATGLREWSWQPPSGRRGAARRELQTLGVLLPERRPQAHRAGARRWSSTASAA